MHMESIYLCDQYEPSLESSKCQAGAWSTCPYAGIGIDAVVTSPCPVPPSDVVSLHGLVLSPQTIIVDSYK
jgi:hypothetical protein